MSVKARSARGWALAFTAALACAGELPQGRSEVPVRELVPVPICASSAEQPWINCMSAPALGGEAAGGASRTEIIWSKPRAPLGVAWLPLPLPEAEGAAEGATHAGWVALVGRRGARREVYGVGSHRGVPESAQLALERIGSELLVVITERRCGFPRAAAGCEGWADLLRLEQGRLPARARLITERALRARRDGRWISYQFSAALEYKPDGVHVSERLAARDAVRGDSEIAELGRVLRFERGRLVESAPSLLLELDASGGSAR